MRYLSASSYWIYLTHFPIIGLIQIGLYPLPWPAWAKFAVSLAVTLVILGGLGNVVGAIVGAVALVGLPEVFRVAAEYRILIYGIVLLLLVRFRPQGLLGTI